MPLLLSPSKQGEELYLYLVVLPMAVNSALLREENRQQLPVYYTNRALRGAEERYPLYRETGVRSYNSSKKTLTILPSSHNSGTHQPPTTEGNEQTRCSQMTNTMVD